MLGREGCAHGREHGVAQPASGDDALGWRTMRAEAMSLVGALWDPTGSGVLVIASNVTELGSGGGESYFCFAI